MDSAAGDFIDDRTWRRSDTEITDYGINRHLPLGTKVLGNGAEAFFSAGDGNDVEPLRCQQGGQRQPDTARRAGHECRASPSFGTAVSSTDEPALCQRAAAMAVGASRRKS